MITISVLLPARDAAATLPEAMDCILEQEDFGLDLELIVADDGSRDDTLRIVQAAGNRDPRVRVLALPRRGLVPTLNDALARARGRYVARMDADDLCSPDRLRRQLAHLHRHPRLDVVGTQVEMFPDQLVSANMRDYLRWQNRLLVHRAIERNLLVESSLTHATGLFRRSSLLRVGGWRESEGPEDLDLWLRGARAGWRFGKVGRVLYRWRERPDRATRTDPVYRRERFRALALDACAEAAGEASVLIWGWGRSLEDWDRGLRERGVRVRSRELNPRGLRGGTEPPAPPERSTLARLRLDRDGGPPRGLCWLLAYGTMRSRGTLARHLAAAGYREGVDYRFVS